MSGFSSTVEAPVQSGSMTRRDRRSTASLSKKRGHSRPGSEYAVYTMIAYPMLLVAALMLRILPTRPKFHGVKRRRPSVFREAWEMGQSAMPWVFSGR